MGACTMRDSERKRTASLPRRPQCLDVVSRRQTPRPGCGWHGDVTRRGRIAVRCPHCGREIETQQKRAAESRWSSMPSAESRPCPEAWGKTWRVTPTRSEQRLWTWACSKAHEKLIPFILRAVLERCRWVVAERIRRGAQVEQWVSEEIERLSRR